MSNPRAAAANAMLLALCATWVRVEGPEAVKDWLRDVAASVPDSVGLAIFKGACGRLRREWTDPYSPPKPAHVAAMVGVIQRELERDRPRPPLGTRTAEEGQAIMNAAYRDATSDFMLDRRHVRALEENARRDALQGEAAGT